MIINDVYIFQTYDSNISLRLDAPARMPQETIYRSIPSLTLATQAQSPITMCPIRPFHLFPFESAEFDGIFTRNLFLEPIRLRLIIGQMIVWRCEYCE
jgi:hypothetical protein